MHAAALRRVHVHGAVAHDNLQLSCGHTRVVVRAHAHRTAMTPPDPPSDGSPPRTTPHDTPRELRLAATICAGLAAVLLLVGVLGARSINERDIDATTAALPRGSLDDLFLGLGTLLAVGLDVTRVVLDPGHRALTDQTSAAAPLLRENRLRDARRLDEARAAWRRFRATPRTEAVSARVDRICPEAEPVDVARCINRVRDALDQLRIERRRSRRPYEFTTKLGGVAGLASVMLGLAFLLARRPRKAAV